MQRLDLLKQNLRLDHLNKKEKQSIEPIIENFNDIFYFYNQEINEKMQTKLHIL
jgi:hypothetical protein